MIFLKKQFTSGFICCLLLTFSINVLANYIYKAKDIEFNSSYTNMNNVEDAINEIYDEMIINKADLLWENNNLDSDFDAQKIYLDLSKYKYIVIVACYSKNNCTSHTKSLIKVGTSDKYISGNNINYACTFRNVDVDKDGINFSTGYVYVDNNDLNYNYVALPDKIYGIKNLNVS